MFLVLEKVRENKNFYIELLFIKGEIRRVILINSN